MVASASARRVLWFFTLTLVVAATVCADERRVIEPRWRHVRQHGDREWSTFPQEPDARRVEVSFQSRANQEEATLQLRQQDVKQAWRVLLNDKPLGELVRDEGEMVVYLPIGPGQLVDGDNRLLIECTALGRGTEDDIRVGEIYLDPRPQRQVLGEASLDLAVVDAEGGQPLPARLTIVDERGGLQTTDAVSNEGRAVRQGVIYSRDGRARFQLPAGRYTIYAGRGFEYSRAEVAVTLAKGDTAQRTFTLRREVATPGYVACDTHIHTRTFSGHGDATIAERMITLAGEGIELPVATDHNTHIDYETHARQAGVRQYFTPIMGNEVTTPAGHFNIFPVATGARLPNYRSPEWPTTFREIFATPATRVAILNHARDLHSGVRPFGPERFQDAVGEQLDGWPLRFNAMEVINSGATQSTPLQLARDWMTLLNRGQLVTPVGSSDSHDVARFIVGQGRTYVRCDDQNVANLDVGLAVDSFLAGRVLVSYGLLAELVVDGKYRGGDLAAVAGDELAITLRVLGPHWTDVSRVQLFANGQLVRDERLSGGESSALPMGVRWQSQLTIPRPAQDVHLVAIATGPGVSCPAWPTAKPYQPTSPEWTPNVLGISGAVWVDADGDGRRSSARDYAERICGQAAGDPDKLVTALSNYDAPTASHAAHVWRTSGRSLDDPNLVRAVRAAPVAVRDGFRVYREASEENDRRRQMAP